MNTMYLCYLSLFDPLVQTQVVAYLEGLTQAGYRIVLLTFEPLRPNRSDVQQRRKQLAAKGIEWHWLRYHKRPTVLATSWDIFAGIAVAYRLIRRHKVRLLHARGHVPGVIALVLKRLTGTKMLFDIRGFMAEEYVDGGVWRQDGFLFRITKRMEKALVRAADAYVVLTSKAKEQLNEWYPEELEGKPIQVIPCCVDLRPTRRIEQRQQRKNRNTVSLVYVGKLEGWYLTEEMVRFFATARKLFPTLRLQIWTQSDATLLQQLFARYQLDGQVSVGQIQAEKLTSELVKCQAGLSFVKPCLSKRASSPTKVGEYLAAGLPVVTTSGVGDVDELLKVSDHLERTSVGVVVRDFSEEAYADAARELQKLLSDPEIRSRCRAVAKKHLDLVSIGWRRYRELYAQLL